MRILVLGTGGTISSRISERGVAAEMTAAELVATVASGQVPPGATIETRDLGTRPSFAFTVNDMRCVVLAAIRGAAGDFDAVVVLHGTDSMEETSFLADLLHHGPEPIVFTGAQYPADADAPDGPRNIAAALQVAADPRARDRGALVAFGGQIWPARGVRK